MRLVFILAVLVSVTVAAPVRAELRALLVGVTTYEMPSIPALRGPANDILLMRDVLEKRGVARTIMLSSDIDGARAPTRAAILDGFAAIGDGAGAGDLIYIHLSGHGSRQTDFEGDETDGLDEIFLPVDTARAPGGAGTVPNAIPDDEIGRMVAAIRAQGADVFLVMDSCHAGSGVRSAASGIVERKVEPGVLGLTGDVARGVVAGTRGNSIAPATPPNWGGYQAFYATRANDVAREADFAPEGAADSEWYGLFTTALAARLESSRGQTYRQLFQAVLSDLNDGGLHGAGAIQTPVWEGSMIDQPVFGDAGKPGPHRYLIDGSDMDAGLVHGLRKGTLVALSADTPEDISGYAQVEALSSRRATLRSVAPDCEPDAARLCSRLGALPDEARFASVEQHPIDQTIRFSPVLDYASGDALAADDPLHASLRIAMEAAEAMTRTILEGDAETYDVHLALHDGQLWFGQETWIGDDPVGLSLARPVDPTELSAALVRIVRAELLARSLDIIADGKSPFNRTPLAIRADRFASPLSALSRPGEPPNPQAECRAALATYSEAGLETLAPASDLKQCDMLNFSVKGTRSGQRDVNRIHIDAHYCIHVDYDLVEGQTSERDLGAPMVICADCPAPALYSAGNERLYMLVSELEENREALNLTGLIENCGASFAGKRSARCSTIWPGAIARPVAAWALAVPCRASGSSAIAGASCPVLRPLQPSDRPSASHGDKRRPCCRMPPVGVLRRVDHLEDRAAQRPRARRCGSVPIFARILHRREHRGCQGHRRIRLHRPMRHQQPTRSSIEKCPRKPRQSFRAVSIRAKRRIAGREQHPVGVDLQRRDFAGRQQAIVVGITASGQRQCGLREVGDLTTEQAMGREGQDARARQHVARQRGLPGLLL